MIQFDNGSSGITQALTVFHRRGTNDTWRGTLTESCLDTSEMQHNIKPPNRYHDNCWYHSMVSGIAKDPRKSALRLHTCAGQIWKTLRVDASDQGNVEEQQTIARHAISDAPIVVGVIPLFSRETHASRTMFPWYLGHAATKDSCISDRFGRPEEHEGPHPGP